MNMAAPLGADLCANSFLTKSRADTQRCVTELVERQHFTALTLVRLGAFGVGMLACLVV
ncbi:hypothetical protein MOKP64_39550 [Mycobacterium avium subsp. hominissuis]